MFGNFLPQRPGPLPVDDLDPVKARDLFASGHSHVLWGTLDMIALFAPEIRTVFPISAVRLARKIKEIEAMV